MISLRQGLTALKLEHQEEGTTLLEAVIVVGIMVLLLGVVLLLQSSVYAFWAHTTGLSEGQSECQVVLRWMEKDIRECQDFVTLTDNLVQLTTSSGTTVEYRLEGSKVIREDSSGVTTIAGSIQAFTAAAVGSTVVKLTVQAQAEEGPPHTTTTWVWIRTK